MMIVLVLLFRWNYDLCSSASGMTRHTLHTAHNHDSGLNKSKFYNGKYTHTISRGEKDTHTDGRTDTTVANRNSVEFRCTSFEVLQQENPGIFRRLLPASFPQGF